MRAAIGNLKRRAILRIISSSLARESDHCLPRSLAERTGITHDALAHAEIVATAKHNGIADLTCEDNVVGTVCLSHASIIQYVRDIASTNRTKSDFFLVTDPTPLLKNANYTTSCSCGGESFFNLS